MTGAAASVNVCIMEAVQHEVRPTPGIAIVSLVLAGCAALSLVLGDAVLHAVPDADALVTLLFVLGWVLVAWAAIGVVVALARLLLVGGFRRRSVRVESAFVLAATAVIVGTTCMYPLIGTGSGSA